MGWLIKLRSLWNRDLARQLDDELQSHGHLRAEALMAEGWSKEKAYDEARRLFGNLTLTTEWTRDVHVSAWGRLFCKIFNTRSGDFAAGPCSR